MLASGNLNNLIAERIKDHVVKWICCIGETSKVQAMSLFSIDPCKSKSLKICLDFSLIILCAQRFLLRSLKLMLIKSIVLLYTICYVANKCVRHHAVKRNTNKNKKYFSVFVLQMHVLNVREEFS